MLVFPVVSFIEANQKGVPPKKTHPYRGVRPFYAVDDGATPMGVKEMAKPNWAGTCAIFHPTLLSNGVKARRSDLLVRLPGEAVRILAAVSRHQK